MKKEKRFFNQFVVSFVILVCFVSLDITKIFAVDTTATFNPSNVVCSNYIGNGVQWDPYDVLIDFSSNELATITERVGFMNIKFIRCCIMATFYWTGSYDANGDPNNYNWNTTQMQRLYQILDYCQSNGVTVMLGEWDPPGREWQNHVWADNPAWPKMVADCLNYLYNTKGYTCIKYYNLGNEPNGNWMSCGYNYINGQDLFTDTDAQRYNNWRAAIQNLYTELGNRGYTSWIKMTGPDNAWNDEWVGKAAAAEGSRLGIYDFHRYATQAETEGGNYQKDTVSNNLTQILTKDPNGSTKPMVVSELGMLEGKISPDSQPNVQNFIYGVWMADLVAQSICGGAFGTSAWDLDDAMHTGGGYGTLNLKEWGLWNIKGGTNGYPQSDWNVRPWFYTWSLMSKFIPQGSLTMAPAYSPRTISGLRVTAMRKANGSNWDVTFLVVNDSDRAKSVKIVLSGGGSCTLKQYNYFDSDRPVDGNGYPVAKQDLSCNLNTGFTLSLPTRGVIILTTMDGGTPVAISMATPTPTPVPTPLPTPIGVIQNLASYYNEDAFSYDRNITDGNYDGSGSSGKYAADLLNSNPFIDGASYTLGPKTDGMNNSIKCTGQTVNLTQSQYTSIRFLGSATNGDTQGTFRINYTDSTYTDVVITEKDWCSTSIDGQKIAQTMGHRHVGTADEHYFTYIFAYYLTPLSNKTISSIQLPNNTKMHVLAISAVK